MNDKTRMIIAGTVLGTAILFAAIPAFLPNREAEDEPAAKETTQRRSMLAPESETTVYMPFAASDGDPVEVSRRLRKGPGRQMMGPDGKIRQDQVMVAVMNGDEVEYLPADDPRAMDALANPEEDALSEALAAGTTQITSPVPSDNQSASTVEIPLR